jgi:hypothetical protein
MPSILSFLKTSKNFLGATFLILNLIKSSLIEECLKQPLIINAFYIDFLFPNFMIIEINYLNKKLID